MIPLTKAWFDETLTEANAALGADTARHAWHAGQTLSYDEAVEEAIDELGEAEPKWAPFKSDHLTGPACGSLAARLLTRRPMLVHDSPPLTAASAPEWLIGTSGRLGWRAVAAGWPCCRAGLQSADSYEAENISRRFGVVG